MTDLAVKLFMADSGIDNFDVAQTVLYRYGLAQPYDTLANKLQLILTDEAADADEAYAEGVEFAHQLVSGIQFAVNPETVPEQFCAGIEFCMEQVKAILQAAVDGARMDVTVDAPTYEGPLDLAQVLGVVAQFFDKTGEQTSR